MKFDDAYDLLPTNLMLLEDIFCRKANLFAVIPPRLGEDRDVYEHRVRVAGQSQPFQSVFTKMSTSVASQRLSLEPPTETLDGFRKREPEYIRTISKALCTFGKVWVLPVSDYDGQICLEVVKPSQVLWEAPNELAWLTFMDGVMVNGEPRSFCTLYHYVDGSLETSELMVKKVLSRSYQLRTTRLPENPYQGVYRYVPYDQKNRTLKSVSTEKAKLFCVESELPGGESLLDAILPYLRVRASLVDIAVTSGYVQRTFRPTSQGDLDLPTSYDDLQSDNRHILEADEFGFAEMSGTSMAALQKLLVDLRNEMLAEYGLEMEHSLAASASEGSREISQASYKAVVDQLGGTVRAFFEELYEWMLGTDITLRGLDNYKVRNIDTYLLRLQTLFTTSKECPEVPGWEWYKSFLKTATSTMLEDEPPQFIDEALKALDQTTPKPQPIMEPIKELDQASEEEDLTDE